MATETHATTLPAVRNLILLPADRPDPRTPCRELLEPYRQALEAKKRRPRGIRTDLYTLGLFVAWLDPDICPADITSAAIRRYQEHVSHLAAATIGNRLSVIRSFCKWARREGLMSHDPTQDLDWPKKRLTAPRALKPAQLRELLAALGRPAPARVAGGVARGRTGCFLMLFAGLRLAEAAALRWDHVDLDTGAIMVYDGKNGKDRIVPLHSRLRIELERVPLDERRGAVIKNSAGIDIPRRTLEKTMMRLPRALGLSFSFTAHQLRHSFATQMLRHGADLRSIQVVLGHESLETTMRYILIDPEQTRAAVDAMPATW